MAVRVGGPIRVRAHAKINLNLQVLGRREDGFHDLRTVFQALALHDTLVFAPRPGLFAIECSDARVPTDSSNLAWRAADLLWRHLGRSGAACDVLVRIEKCIPMKAGLGGGSSDAAAALLGLAALWGAQVAAADLAAMGRQLGADVGFFFTGGAARGAGRGDDISPLADLPPLGVLLVFPSFEVSTADAYRWLDEDREGQAGRVGRAGQGGGAPFDSPHPPLQGRSARAVGGLEIANDFEPVVSARHPQITGVVTDLMAAGAAAAAMTGSGSTVFGLFHRDEAMAAAARSLNRLGYALALTRTLTRDEYARVSAPACL